MRHLIELGHRQIAYLGDQFGLQSDTERFAGFKQAMAEAKLPVRRDYVVRGDGRPGKGRERAAELLERKKRPTAIFCYNDMTALGVLEEAA